MGEGPGAAGIERVARYRVVRHVGHGRAGDVYEAVDEETGATVALKILSEEARSDGDLEERFVREARAAGSVHHPNVAATFHAGEADGKLYISMEYVDGRRLRDHILDHPLMPVEEAVRIAREAARGVAAAHAAGVIHRDLKPENILLTPEGEVKVLDFGLAKRTVQLHDPDGRMRTDPSDTITGEGVVVGSPGYMAPEQIVAEPVDARADIFALGVVLYEMLTRGLPFRRESPVLTMVATCTAAPEPPSRYRPDVPDELEAVILRCLEKDPADRFPSCEALIAALDLGPR